MFPIPPSNKKRSSNIHESRYVFCVVFPEFAEADTFFCFTNLMGEIRDIYIKSLDNDLACGIGKLIRSASKAGKFFPELFFALQAGTCAQ